MNILQAMADPKLFAKTFQPKKSLLTRKLGIDTWGRWRVFLSALFGLELTAEEFAIYQAHTGRMDVRAQQFREAYLIAGRRSGKSLIAALVATFMATLIDYKDVLAPGEVGTVLILAS